MAIFEDDDPTSLLGQDSLMEKNYLLTPWPWAGDNTPFTPTDPLTDIVLDGSDDARSESVRETLFLERVTYLWDGQLTLFIDIGEEDIIALENSEGLKRKVTEIMGILGGFPYQGVMWELHLSRNRENYEPLINLWEGIRNSSEIPLPFSYSLGREEKPVPYLLETSDAVIIRAYDFSGRHSTYENAEESVENLIIRRKISHKSLVLALPLYGRKFRSSDPEYWIKKIPYEDIVEAYHPQRDSNSEDYYYFNGPDMAQRKYILSREKELQGIALFPYEWDGRGSYSLKESIASLMRE